MDLIRDASELCQMAHAGQYRKYTNEPYIVHPFAVAGLVAAVLPNNMTAIAAAFLHDVLEDTGVSEWGMEQVVGQHVVRLVLQVTDISTPDDGNRALRKAKDRHHLAQASPEAKTIKLADLIDNTKSIRLYDPDFAVVYLREKRALLEVLKEGNAELWRIAARLAE